MSNLRSFIGNLPTRQPRVPVILFILIAGVTLALALSIGTAAKHPEVAQAGACDNLRILDVSGGVRQSNAWSTTRADWISFKVQKGSRYLLQASDPAGLDLALFDRCDASAPAVVLKHGRLEFTATRDGEYFLQVRQNGLASQTGYQVSLSTAAPHLPSVIAAQEVPPEVLRHATEFLEKLRGSGLAPEWLDARINPQIGVLYRPDIQGPAYYEARVEKPSATGFQPAGYILLASGDHDYLVVNWGMSGMSTSEELAELAPLGATLTQIFRLTPLSYAAEYEQGTLIGITTTMTDVVTLGDLPPRIEGLNALPDQAFELVTQGIDSTGKETYEDLPTCPCWSKPPGTAGQP